MAKPYYITTTLPYVNADPHIGFALEIIQADVLARWHRLSGFEVVFNTGTDEHGLKIYQRALEEDMEPQKYCDKYAPKFDALKHNLNLTYTNFIRTTSTSHIKAAQEFWKLCEKNGDIYKKIYQGKYCVGCELEKTDSELVDGKCPIHPTLEIKIVEEENYFFRFSNYQDKLLKLYKSNPNFVVPSFRYNEIIKFVESGLRDFSISRLKNKMPWGIPVPGDENHVMYVWFDALINYISTLNWSKTKNGSKFAKFWGTEKEPNAIQVAGKDNLRQQSAMWQAMLMSAELPNSKQILIHGFITSGGQKMAKSTGNIVDPFELVENYGTDAVRYYLLRGISPFEDGDFTIEKFEARYNGELANGLGNLVARTAKLCETLREKFGYQPTKTETYSIDSEVERHLEGYRFDQALNHIWEENNSFGVSHLNAYIDKHKPWIWEEKNDRDFSTFVEIVEGIRKLAFNLQPFLPHTAEKILKQFEGGEKKITKGDESLFPRV